MAGKWVEGLLAVGYCALGPTRTPSVRNGLHIPLCSLGFCANTIGGELEEVNKMVTGVQATNIFF